MFSLVIIFCVVAISLVCLHSVDEIHYLKSFFPPKFSVSEAFYASGVELIKVLIISLPLVVIICICLRNLSLLRGKEK